MNTSTLVILVIKWQNFARVRLQLNFFFQNSSCPWRFRRQKFKTEPPHVTVCHHFHHFAWLKPQPVPPKILNVVIPMCSRSSNRHFPFNFHRLSNYSNIFILHVVIVKTCNTCHYPFSRNIPACTAVQLISKTR